MAEISIVWFALLSIPIFAIAAFADWKTKKIDVRNFWFLKGLAYAGFFANDVWFPYALAVSFSIVLLQIFLSKFKISPVGSGDFPVFHAYNLIVMLFAPHLFIFIGFFIVPLIFFGLWNWYFRDRSFVPAVALSLALFYYSFFFVWK